MNKNRDKNRKKAISFMLSICLLFTLFGSVEQEGRAATLRQPGDMLTLSMEDAIDIGYSRLYDVQIGERTLYRFTTTENKDYYQIKANVATEAALHVAIYDEWGSNVSGEAVLLGRAATRAALQASSVYYLEVYGGEDAEGSFILSSIRDDFKDTAEAATGAACNKEYAVTTELPGDVDYLRFDIGTEDALYVLEIDPTAGSGGGYELYDSEGNLVEGCSGSTDGETILKQPVKLTAGQSYYLKIFSMEAMRQVVVCLHKTTNVYKITYQLDGGTNHKSNVGTYKASDTVKLYNPTKSGYLFAGWYSDSKFKTKVTSIKGSSKKAYTLYAKWTKVAVGQGTVSSFTSPQKGQAQLKYNTIAGVKGYEVRFGTTSGLEKAKTYRLSKTEKLFKGLTKGKKYYAKVRGWQLDSKGKKVYGAYSSVKSVTVKKDKPKKKAAKNKKKNTQKSNKKNTKKSSKKK